MPQQTPYTQQDTVRLRKGGRIAGTNYVNEIAEKMNKAKTLPKFGQVVDATGVSGGSVKGKGELQGQVLIMRTNSSVGWDDVFFVPPR